MMALTPKRLFLSLCISISLLRLYTFFSRSQSVSIFSKSHNTHFSLVQKLLDGPDFVVGQSTQLTLSHLTKHGLNAELNQFRGPHNQEVTFGDLRTDTLDEFLDVQARPRQTGEARVDGFVQTSSDGRGKATEYIWDFSDGLFVLSDEKLDRERKGKVR